MRQTGDSVYFSGTGASDQGDRPFLDLRRLDTGETERLFRCDPDRYEYFEDHGYRARESVEHVLWEQLRWFDKYVKGAGT